MQHERSEPLTEVGTQCESQIKCTCPSETSEAQGLLFFEVLLVG